MPRWGACGGRGPKCRGGARERPSHTHWGEHGGRALRPEGPVAQPGALYLVLVIREGGRRREPGGAEDAGGRRQAAGGGGAGGGWRSRREWTAAGSVEEKSCGWRVPAF